MTLILAALAPTLTALAGLRASLGNRKRIDEVHVIVNGRFTDALKKIDELEHRLNALAGPAPKKRRPRRLSG